MAKYVPLNSLTLSRINQIKTGNSGGSREPSQGSKLHHPNAPNDDAHNNDESTASGVNNIQRLPWWKQFPAKTKNKNAQILEELNKITEELPEWPWVGAKIPGKGKLAKTQSEMS